MSNDIGHPINPDKLIDGKFICLVKCLCACYKGKLIDYTNVIVLEYNPDNETAPLSIAQHLAIDGNGQDISKEESFIPKKEVFGCECPECEPFVDKLLRFCITEFDYLDTIQQFVSEGIFPMRWSIAGETIQIDFGDSWTDVSDIENEIATQLSTIEGLTVTAGANGFEFCLEKSLPSPFVIRYQNSGGKDDTIIIANDGTNAQFSWGITGTNQGIATNKFFNCGNSSQIPVNADVPLSELQ